MFATSLRAGTTPVVKRLVGTRSHAMPHEMCNTTDSPDRAFHARRTSYDVSSVMCKVIDINPSCFYIVADQMERA